MSNKLDNYIELIESTQENINIKYPDLEERILSNLFDPFNLKLYDIDSKELFNYYLRDVNGMFTDEELEDIQKSLGVK